MIFVRGALLHSQRFFVWGWVDMRRSMVSLVLTVVLIPSFLISSSAPAFANRVQTPRRFSAETLPEPRFADPERAKKLAAAFPEIEKAFLKRVGRQHMPGAVFGIIINGKLAWVKSAGIANVKTRTPVTF